MGDRQVSDTGGRKGRAGGCARVLSRKGLPLFVLGPTLLIPLLTLTFSTSTVGRHLGDFQVVSHSSSVSNLQAGVAIIYLTRNESLGPTLKRNKNI